MDNHVQQIDKKRQYLESLTRSILDIAKSDIEELINTVEITCSDDRGDLTLKCSPRLKSIFEDGRYRLKPLNIVVESEECIVFSTKN